MPSVNRLVETTCGKRPLVNDLGKRPPVNDLRKRPAVNDFGKRPQFNRLVVNDLSLIELF